MAGSMCERGGLIAKDDYAAFSQPPPLPWHRRDSRRITAAPPRTLLHCRQQSTQPASERKREQKQTQHLARSTRQTQGVAGCTALALGHKICRNISLCAMQMSPRKAFDFWRGDAKKYLIAACLGGGLCHCHKSTRRKPRRSREGSQCK